MARGFEKEIEGVELKLKWASEERDKLLGEMRDARELAKMKEDHIRDQEDQIRAFKDEIDRMKRLIEEKKQEIKRL